jgi:uncharacterized protein (DUF1015 family)
MALIYPFQAYRFDKDVVGDLSAVVTQPYDKISESLQQDYYGRSPYNVVRITRNAEKNRDPDTDYSDAGCTLERWLAEGVLRQDSAPAIYAYNQEYEIEEERKLQRGFVALLDLKHSGAGILPHERTFAEPKMDRLRLMRKLECQDDLIYMLYTDERMTVNQILEEKTEGSPAIEAIDDDSVIHKVWAITEPQTLKRICGAMVAEELFIADGHHRFETSLNFLKECESRGWKPAARESFDMRLVTCFNSADQGTTILPTHRLVRGIAGFDSRAFLSLAAQYFEVEQLGSADHLWGRMKQGRQVNHVFGFYPADTRRFYLLSLREEAKIDPLMLSHPEVYRHLDVSILHTLVLDRFLGIDELKLVSQENVDYARDRNACIRSVDEGRYQAAFFLNPTSVEHVQRVALLGERMPQKSTDFYPKLLTGLVFMKMKIEKPA